MQYRKTDTRLKNYNAVTFLPRHLIMLICTPTQNCKTWDERLQLIPHLGIVSFYRDKKVRYKSFEWENPTYYTTKFVYTIKIYRSEQGADFHSPITWVPQANVSREKYGL